MISINKNKLIKEIIVGCILSFIMIRFGLTMPFTLNLLIIIPVSVVYSLIDKRFTCLSYTIATLYLIYNIVLKLGISNASLLRLPYEKFIILIGILHIAEGVMTICAAKEDNEVTVGYKENRLVGGYRTCKRWTIPLFLFQVKGIYIPVLVILVYAGESFTMSIQKKSRVMGRWILLYGMMISLLGYLGLKQLLPLELAVICMPIFHEILFEINEKIENKNSIT
ncbi:MAG: hypothetical protein K0S30_62 [Clostridia bacterium]|nr:hypothetical protein [Clostridia bacterium]